MNTYRDEYTLSGNSVDISDWVEIRMLQERWEQLMLILKVIILLEANGLTWLKKTAKI